MKFEMLSQPVFPPCKHFSLHFNTRQRQRRRRAEDATSSLQGNTTRPSIHLPPNPLVRLDLVHMRCNTVRPVSPSLSKIRKSSDGQRSFHALWRRSTRRWRRRASRGRRAVDAAAENADRPSFAAGPLKCNVTPGEEGRDNPFISSLAGKQLKLKAAALEGWMDGGWMDGWMDEWLLAVAYSQEIMMGGLRLILHIWYLVRKILYVVIFVTNEKCRIH